MLRPSISRGCPAFGCADSFTVATRASRSIASSIAAGPTLQLSPTTSAPQRSSSGTKASGAAPSRVFPSSSVVICATIGRSQTERTARIAAPISLTSRNVSSTKRSTPPSSERARLFREVLLRLVHAGLAPRLDADPERTDRPGDPGLIPRGMTRDARALHVDRVHLVGQAEMAQLDPVGAEGVRLDDVRPVTHVGLVDFGDQIGLGEVQLVEGPVEEDAFGVQHRAHRAVADEHAPIELGEKGGLDHECAAGDARPPPAEASLA